MFKDERRIKRLLKDLGVPQGYTGYEYLAYAIHLVIENREVLSSVTKNLYPAVGTYFRKSGLSAERAMHRAINAASDNTPDLTIYKAVFGNTIRRIGVRRIAPPRSRHYIAACADFLRTSPTYGIGLVQREV